MAITIGSGFALHKKSVLDDRTLFETIADMKNYSENFLGDMGYAFVKENGKMYIFNRENEVSDTTGKWRLFEGSGGDAELETSAIAAIDVGGIVKGKEYIAGTPLEDILRDLVFGGSSQITLNTCFNGILSSPADINETAILGLTKGEFGNTFEYVYNAEGQIMVAVFPRDLNIVIKNSMFTLNWNSVDMLIGGLPFTCYYSNILKVTDYKVTFITE